MAVSSVLAIFSFILYLSLTASANSDTKSSSFSSTQIKFWAENVQNEMPAPIFKKLSPLTQNQCDYYTTMIFKNHNFTADATFCSLAKLACSSIFDDFKKVKNGYTTENEYNQQQAASLRVLKNDFSFFRASVLENGNSIHLPNLQESIPDRAFLPPQISSKIFLTSSGITKLFPYSASGESIKTTLFYCNAKAIKGETKLCPKSLEEMISFSKTALGGKNLMALTSKSTKGSNSQLVINKIKKFNVDRIVACHEVFLPFAAYFCHSLPSTNLYSVDVVEPKTMGLMNTLIAICHMDTSPWPENHVAFRILKFRPGQGEACHWFSNIDVAWISEVESV